MLDLAKHKFRVIGNNVLMVRDPQPEDNGTIVIPEEYRKYTAFGEIIQVGGLVKKVEVGQRVMFHKNYTFLPFEQRRAAITQEDKIIGIIMQEEKAETFEPLGAFLLIKPEVGKRVVGQIALPNDPEQVYGGKLLAMGPDCIELEPDARVFYNHGLAIECQLGGELHHIITEEHILCQTNNK